MQKTSPVGLAIIKAFESCLAPVKGRPGYFKPYFDPVGVLTIGWGHTNDHAPRFLQSAVWSQQQCDDALAGDVALFERHVAKQANGQILFCGASTIEVWGGQNDTAFVQGAVCPKEDIGRKVTAGGIIAISNWHVLSEESEPPEDEDIQVPGDAADPKAVVQSILPLTPGTSQGNDLNVLNRRYERGGVLDYLKELPALMVFNDEAHHIHEFKREGEVTEVEWQKSLNLIAEPKGRRFVQVDFSATPYNEVGTGRNSRKSYFPHIVVDFDLKTAMRAGLVKSLMPGSARSRIRVRRNSHSRGRMTCRQERGPTGWRCAHDLDAGRHR